MAPGDDRTTEAFGGFLLEDGDDGEEADTVKMEGAELNALLWEVGAAADAATPTAHPDASEALWLHTTGGKTPSMALRNDEEVAPAPEAHPELQWILIAAVLGIATLVGAALVFV